MRYAEANAVNASLQMVDGAVHVSIEDNGKGFNTTKHPPQNSFGILGMRERVLSQGGNFQVQSQKGGAPRWLFQCQPTRKTLLVKTVRSEVGS